MDDQGLNLAASFCKKIEKGMHQSVVGPKPNQGKFSPFRVLFSTPKVRIGSWMPNALPCSGAIQTPLLGFLGQSLYLNAFSSSVYDFFIISFLDNSAFLRAIILKINTLKQILIKFRLSTVLLLSNHPFYSYACIPILNTNYQPITKLFN